MSVVAPKVGGEAPEPEQGDAQPQPEEDEVAQPRRYADAKRDIGKFVRTGETSYLSRGIGHYSRSGMGGARKLSSRMRASANAGSALVSFIKDIREGTDPAIASWVQNLLASNPSSDEVADAIVQALSGPGGSVDEESMRDSMALAISELLVLQPDVELLNMKDADTWTLLQLFLGNEVCNRLSFDIGQFFESAKLDPELGVLREMEMRDFVKNEVGVQLEALRANSPNPTKAQLDALVNEALRMTFEAYEGTL
ncbi:Qat anti-phage system associated protein QatB [Cupriavidus sp. 2MCAB6]|uniref:Qat anti-phage system associated protein QatB n=1 Tax=Cupriavidus sp. 2MCAB6 TaxID=3232981 RepID=UPI003F928BEC